MLWTRVASGVVLASLFLWLVYKEQPYFDVLMIAIAAMMAWEFLRMDGKSGLKRRGLVVAGAVGAVVAMALGYAAAAFAIILVTTAGLIVSDRVAGRKGFQTIEIAVLYAAVPAVALLYMMGTGGARSVFWLLAVVWATDTGAYAFGRIIGGPKLAPSVSPNKTWSGAVGGLVSAVLISAGILFWGYGQDVSPVLLVSAAGLSVVSQAGDLFESALKRRYQVKDSGALIPGHGGVMDRFDGLWAAAPLAAVFCLVLGGGVQRW